MGSHLNFVQKYKTKKTHEILSHQTSIPLTYKKTQHRYKILCINLVKDVAKPDAAAKIILDHIQLPEENYRLGKTKVYWVNHLTTPKCFHTPPTHLHV